MVIEVFENHNGTDAYALGIAEKVVGLTGTTQAFKNYAAKEFKIYEQR